MEDKTVAINEDEVTTQNVDVDQPLLSADETASAIQKNEPIMIDIENKMSIIYSVLKACIKEKNVNIYRSMDGMVSKLVYLTNLPPELLSGVIKKTRENVILDDSILETPDQDSLLRETLVNYYIKQNKIPKSEFLSHVVDDHYYCYDLNEQLKRSGYIWRRLPNTKRAIIVEHPKRVIQRQDYLQRIISYRTDNRPVVYIETKILSKVDKHIRNFRKFLIGHVSFIIVFIAVANNNKGILNYNICVSSSIFKCQKLIEDNIVNNVIPNLTEPSVIILEDKPYYRKSFPVPTIESEKSEMMEWLEINGLPYDKTVHRCELFDLIQKCKIKKDYDSFDTLLFSRGHKILRRPTKTDYLNYYKPVWDNLPVKEEITEFLRKKHPDFWRNLEMTLIKNENSVLCEDLQIDNILDKIFIMANNTDVKKWADAECDEKVDGVEQEEFIIQFQNTFLPEELKKRNEHYLCEIEKIEHVQEMSKLKKSATSS